MSFTLLDPVTEARLRAASFTYAEVGQSARTLPPGYPTLRRTRMLRTRDFAAASSALLSWQVQLRSGFQLAASSQHVELESVVMLRLGLGPLGVSAPCRVVYLVDGSTRCGFAYGTLAGHPESGEELFLLELADDGRITFTITAFSRPANALTRVTGPVGRAVQRAVTGRYLRTLDSC